MAQKSGVAGRLRSFRENLGLTQVEIADRLSLSPQAWNGYERGVSTPTFATLERMTRLFDLNTHWLMSGKGPMQGSALVEHSMLEIDFDKVRDEMEKLSSDPETSRSLGPGVIAIWKAVMTSLHPEE